MGVLNARLRNLLVVHAVGQILRVYVPVARELAFPGFGVSL